MSAEPWVTVVIPTKERASLLARALDSVFRQTYANLDVLVVVDGADPATLAVLDSIGNQRRLHPLINKQSTGVAEARNRAIRCCDTDWVAFLDDDDEWMPEKIAHQMEAALGSASANPVVYSQVLVTDGSSEKVWPGRGIRPDEDISTYLFSKQSSHEKDGIILPITWLLRRELVLEEPFDRSLVRIEDTDWLLRVSRRRDVAFVFVPETLAIWHIDKDRPRLTESDDWRFWLEWARARRWLMSGRGYAGWLLQIVCSHAVASGERSAVWGIGREALVHGRPGYRDMLRFLRIALLHRGMRSRLKGYIDNSLASLRGPPSG
ncbi:MAG TPA: glycosyltransferase family 2 protein [Dehalococcoidia bacterium]|nr:glycosyltransferase family 2 protein [Dehalococcoidia bacterium]